MPRNQIHRLLLATAAALSAVLAGCGPHASSAEENLNKAETVLEAALDAWTRNAPPTDQFATSEPDYKAGYRLLSFLIADSKAIDGTPDRFRIRVALTLKDPQGRAVDKEAWYVVQLGEAATIHRE
jgi:hypothetical protein